MTLLAPSMGHADARSAPRSQQNLCAAAAMKIRRSHFCSAAAASGTERAHTKVAACWRHWQCFSFLVRRPTRLISISAAENLISLRSKNKISSHYFSGHNKTALTTRLPIRSEASQFREEALNCSPSFLFKVPVWTRISIAQFHLSATR